MRPANPLHNPFSNRFNEPVSRRLDEMQSPEYMMWLRDRDLLGGPTQNATSLGKANSWLRTIVALFGLLVLIVTVGVFMTAF